MIRKFFAYYKYFLVLIFINLASFRSLSQTMVTTKIAKGIKVDLLSELIPMIKEDINQQFPTEREPLGTYSTKDRFAYFTVNLAWSKWQNGDEIKAKSFLKSSVLNLFDGVKIMDEGVKVVHKKKCIYFEFESRINGQKSGSTNQGTIIKYNYIQYFISPDRTLVFTFSSRKNISSNMKNAVKKMMNSIRIR